MRLEAGALRRAAVCVAESGAVAYAGTASVGTSTRVAVVRPTRRRRAEEPEEPLAFVARGAARRVVRRVLDAEADAAALRAADDDWVLGLIAA